MSVSSSRAIGLDVFSSLLGEERANGLAAAAEDGFGSRFQGYALDFVFGQVWAESSLSRRELSLLSLGALVALRMGDGIANYISIAQRNGLSEREIEDAITHLAVYAGFPAANAALAVARNVLGSQHSEKKL